MGIWTYDIAGVKYKRSFWGGLLYIKHFDFKWWFVHRNKPYIVVEENGKRKFYSAHIRGKKWIFDKEL